MDLVVADAVGAPLLAIAGDAVAHLPEPRQRLDVNMDQVAWVLPLVPLHWNLGLQVPQTPQPQKAESPGNAGEGRLQQPGNVTEVEPLVAEIHGVLETLWIERPPLGAANTPTFHQRGWTACAVTSQPAVGAAQTDAVLGGQFLEAAAVLQVLGHEPETAFLRQTGIGMAMHGCVRPGWMGRSSTRSGLTPLCH